MKNKKFWRKTGALTLALAVMGNGLGAGPMVGLAAETGTTPISTYSAEEMSRFADNTLEYWEIPGLIEHYNPSYLNSLEQFYYNPGSSTGLSRDQLLKTAAELRDEAKELEYELEDQVDSGILEKNSTGYLDYKDNIKTLKHYAREMEDAAQGNVSTKHILRMARNQQIVKISEMMRTYQMLVSQNEIQKKQLEIAAGSCDSVRRQVSLGMCSGADLRAAEQALAVQQALRDNATQIVLAHNHPNGFCFPSPADIATTKYLKEVLMPLDIRIIDHLIICEGDCLCMSRLPETRDLFVSPIQRLPTVAD